MSWRIKTFGGFALVKLTPEGASPRAVPRRLAALLAILAEAGPTGVPRERLVGLLWEERDPARARHALNQSVYAARQLLSGDIVDVGGPNISLSPSIGVDCAELMSAESAGDLDRAAALYLGPFLDGLSVPGASNFEHWVDSRRTAYQALARRALIRLAAAASERGDRPAAVDAWRRIVDEDPFDADAALGLMRALDEAGRPTAAMQHAGVFERLVRQEMDVSPDPRLAELRDAIAARPSAPGPAGDTAAAGNAPGEPDGKWWTPVRWTKGLPGFLNEASRRIEAGAARVRRWILIVVMGARQRPSVATGSFLVMLAATGIWLFWPDRPPPLVVTSAVLPFGVAGASPEVAFLSDGVMASLTRSLERSGDSTLVDPAAVRRVFPPSVVALVPSLSRDSLLTLAKSLGATRFYLGDVVGNAGQLVVHGSLITGATRRVVADATVVGSLEVLPELTDRLVAALMADEQGKAEVIRRNPGVPPAAVHAFLSGASAYGAGALVLAARHFEQAVELDESFADAALGLALASDWTEDRPARARAIRLALANRSRLGAADRATLRALAGARYPAPSTSREVLSAWEASVDLASDHAGPWVEYGRRLLQDGVILGVPEARARARAALNKALRLDPLNVVAQDAIALLAAMEGTPGEPTSGIAGRQPPVTSGSGLAVGAALLAAAAPELDWAEDRIRRATRLELSALARLAPLRPSALNVGERAVREMNSRAASMGERVDALLARHAYAVIQGRPQVAVRAAERAAAEALEPDIADRLRVLDALYGDGSEELAAESVRSLEARSLLVSGQALADRSTSLANRCVVGQWRAWRGEHVDHSALSNEREETVFDAPVTAGHAACAILIEAIEAVVGEEPHAAAATGRAEGLALVGPASGDLVQYATLALARLRLARGETDLALANLQRRNESRGWPRYIASYLVMEGQLRRRLGDRAGALALFARYLALRRAPEPALQAWRDSVARLAAEPGG